MVAAAAAVGEIESAAAVQGMMAGGDCVAVVAGRTVGDCAGIAVDSCCILRRRTGRRVAVVLVDSALVESVPNTVVATVAGWVAVVAVVVAVVGVEVAAVVVVVVVDVGAVAVEVVAGVAVADEHVVVDAVAVTTVAVVPEIHCTVAVVQYTVAEVVVPVPLRSPAVAAAMVRVTEVDCHDTTTWGAGHARLSHPHGAHMSTDVAQIEPLELPHCPWYQVVPSLSQVQPVLAWGVPVACDGYTQRCIQSLAVLTLPSAMSACLGITASLWMWCMSRILEQCSNTSQQNHTGEGLA